MNWMDFEQLNNRLDRLELKSQITTHVLERVKYLTSLETKDEYEYTEKFARLNELELLLKYFADLKTTTNLTN